MVCLEPRLGLQPTKNVGVASQLTKQSIVAFELENMDKLIGKCTLVK